MKKRTILLIEDDELDIISFQRALTKLDAEYDLLIAYNGREALSMLTDKENLVEPDVILLDLNMPKMNGLEFLTAIRQEERLVNTKIFIMTTSGEVNDRSRAEHLGISGYFIKPLGYTDNNKRPDSMDSFVQFHLRRILSS